MSIATTLQSIRTNLTAAWTALTNKGATIPANKNIENLATAIASIPAGSNKVPSVVDRSVTTITAEDLAGGTSIGSSAFYYCTSLTSITIPDSVTSIGNNAFYGCTSLTSVTIPSSVTIIWGYAFYNCSSLTSITIPDSVTSIWGYAFYNCSSLTSVTIKPTTPPTLGTAVFSITNNCPIYVPAGSVNAYKTATNWSSLASRIQAIPA